VFLPAFAHLHPKHRFPDVSLVAIGLLALPACLFPLDAIINALTTGMVLIGSVAQIAALFVVRRRGTRAPYRMWLFPLPAIVALVGWAFIFEQAGTPAIVFGLATLAAGLVAYAAWAMIARAWPFAIDPT
jgi:amino acid transporter